MKIIFFVFLMSVAAGFAAPGLLVTTAIPHVNYVRDEPVVLDVTIENTSVFAYIVDDYPPYNVNKIELFVRDSRNRLLLSKTDAAPVAEIIIKPGEKKEFKINAGDLYDFTEEDNYRLTVVAVRGDDSAASHVVSFSLVAGIKIKTARRATLSGGELEYQLLYWPRNGQEILFMRIKDPKSGAVAGFANLGPVVRVAEPKIEFEEDAIIVTHQSERHRFMRTKLVTGAGGGLQVVGADSSLSPGARLEAAANANALQRIAELQANPPKEDKKPFVRAPSTPPAAETRKK